MDRNTDRIAAFVDESGQPSRTGDSSNHFTLGAVVVRKSRLHETEDWLVETKAAVNRKAHHELHWNRIKHAHQRQEVAKRLGEQTWGRFTAVVVCKPALQSPRQMNDDESYLYTMRYLCERLSWFARSHGMPLDLTIAHRVRFKRASLDLYERRLRSLADCRIDWRYLDLSQADLSQPKRCSPLQVADSVASAIAGAFEPNPRGEVHPEYVRAFAPRLYRGANRTNPLTYGIKVHPGASSLRCDHPWLKLL